MSVKICKKDYKTGKQKCMDLSGGDITGDEFGILLFEKINGGERDLKEGIKKKLLYEHNTLQQGFFRTVAGIISDYSKDARYIDARNESSKRFADEVTKLIYDENINFPLI